MAEIHAFEVLPRTPLGTGRLPVPLELSLVDGRRLVLVLDGQSLPRSLVREPNVVARPVKDPARVDRSVAEAGELLDIVAVCCEATSIEEFVARFFPQPDATGEGTAAPGPTEVAMAEPVALAMAEPVALEPVERVVHPEFNDDELWQLFQAVGGVMPEDAEKLSVEEAADLESLLPVGATDGEVMSLYLFLADKKRPSAAEKKWTREETLVHAEELLSGKSATEVYALFEQVNHRSPCKRGAVVAAIKDALADRSALAAE